MKLFFFLLWLAVLLARLALRRLNLRHLSDCHDVVPEGFEGVIDVATLRRAADYTLALNRLGLAELLAGQLLLGGFFFAGWLAAYDRWVGALGWTFIWQGLVFFLGLALLNWAASIPFDLYHRFRLEKRFGFNTMTLALWAADQLKGLVISGILLGLLLAGAFTLVEHSPDWWWLWVWGFFVLVSLVLMYLSPVLIEPWFFKFSAVARDGLEAEIRALMQQAKLPVSRVLQVDASRRSRHSNAYFTGIGRVKRIVLFDTLLEQMENREILAVLAHEAGHWKKKHVLKRMLLSQGAALLACLAAFLLLRRGVAGPWLNLPHLSFFAEVTILAFLGGLLGFLLTPLGSWLSRRDEWQADRFALRLLGEGRPLASALIKLSRENLANLHPHPWYAWFYYSHPPVTERVAFLHNPLRGRGA
jgi:STE24 endopeptidase